MFNIDKNYYVSLNTEVVNGAYSKIEVESIQVDHVDVNDAEMIELVQGLINSSQLMKGKVEQFIVEKGIDMFTGKKIVGKGLRAFPRIKVSETAQIFTCEWFQTDSKIRLFINEIGKEYAKSNDASASNETDSELAL